MNEHRYIQYNGTLCHFLLHCLPTQKERTVANPPYYGVNEQEDLIQDILSVLTCEEKEISHLILIYSSP